MANALNLFGDDVRGTWSTKFGDFDYPNGHQTVDVITGVEVGGDQGWHAETQFSGVWGGDFEYSATITLRPSNRPLVNLHADLLFRISDAGRYGVGVSQVAPTEDGSLQAVLRLYRFMLPDRTCSPVDASAFAHCPCWIGDDDPQIYRQLGVTKVKARRGAGLDIEFALTVEARGNQLTVSGGEEKIQVTSDPELRVGRFGLYVLSDSQQLDVYFTDVRASAQGLARSNFALLYSTTGYDTGRSKRALLRTLNDLSDEMVAQFKPTFNVIGAEGGSVFIDPVPFAPIETESSRTLGFQAWVADFTTLESPGTYILEASLPADGGGFKIRTEPFLVEKDLLSNRVVGPMSILNANARRAANDDFRRNWQIESGHDTWSVGVDGAFIADRADDGAGATLRRFFDGLNSPLLARDFRYIGRITIIEGCDAQLQFRITDTDRWAATLQAGSSGGCRHGDGPGAIRLHRETVHGGFEILGARPFAEGQFRIGQPHSVEIRARGGQIVVVLDDVPVLEHCDYRPAAYGQFAIKAWASSVRFERVQAWGRDVPLSHATADTWIPYFPSVQPSFIVGVSAQGVDIVTRDGDAANLFEMPPADRDRMTRYPYFSVYHGFHDCNNVIGEATSHGIFLAGLMDVWGKRASGFALSDIEALRSSIVTAVLYLMDLFDHGAGSGEFAHQETGRGAFEPGNSIANTRSAIYGLSSFAAYGSYIDDVLAARAFALAGAGVAWLAGRGDADPTVLSVVFARLAVAAQRLGRVQGPEPTASGLWTHAVSAADDVLDTFGQDDYMSKLFRESGRSIPWFEGVYEVFTSGQPNAALNERRSDRVSAIATQLVNLGRQPANAFMVMPQASDNSQSPDPSLPVDNWNDMEDLPRAHATVPIAPVGDAYQCDHFATAAADCTYIGELSGNAELEPLASGNLHWMLGLNPGVPAGKVVAPTDDAEQPWRATSFIYDGVGAFARTIEGMRTITSSSKGWLAPWEGLPSSQHRETWWVDLLGNGFQTIVNGHILRDGQWDYWNVGNDGWVCAETFMLTDGIVLKAAIALEDWVAARSRQRNNCPYDTTKVALLDTTHTDRVDSGWAFDDPDRTIHAQAARSFHQIAVSKGFLSGRPTGHYIGERVGTVFIPPGLAAILWVNADEISSSSWPFSDIDSTPWAQVARAATELAVVRRGYGAGFFTGQARTDALGRAEAYQLVCLGPEIANIFDADDADVAAQAPWAFDDVNQVNWAQAARVATGISVTRGFTGGFFDGHQVGELRGVVGLAAR